MPKDYSEIDRQILEAIQSFEGIPNPTNLSKEKKGPVQHTILFIRNRIRANPRLKGALDDKGIFHIKKCSRAEFVESVCKNRWAYAKGSLKQAIDERVDRHILAAISCFNGVPTTYNLAKSKHNGPLDYSPGLILKRIKQNPALAQSLEEKGVKFVQSCPDNVFYESIAGNLWTNVGEKVRDAIYKRADAHIQEAITSFQGVPTLNSLCDGPLEFSDTLVSARLKENPPLMEAFESHGMQYVQECDRPSFEALVSDSRSQFFPDAVKEAIFRRMDGDILLAINSFDGAPNATTLSRQAGGQLSYSPRQISRRIEANRSLKSALEERGLLYTSMIDREEFDKLVSSPVLSSSLSDRVRQAVLKRLDWYILEAIKSFEGIPNIFNLSKAKGGPLSYHRMLITGRLNSNPDLKMAIEARGIQYIKECSQEVFNAAFTRGIWNQATGKIKEAIYRRTDNCILDAIMSFDGMPSRKNLSVQNGGPLPYGVVFLRGRLRANPDLRKTFYVKRGMSEDRINALEIEQENPSSALIKSIAKRLPNTRIFREALGVLRQFRALFENKEVLEVSFYPEPLQRAANMLGIQTFSEYLRAHKLKRTDFRFKLNQQFDSIAMLQFCHRLNDEALVNTFNEANRILAEAGALLISLPHEYSRTHAFESQVQSFGFELKTEGTLYTRTLGIEELATLGVEDPERLKQKVEQATNLIMLVKTIPAIGKELDGFVPAKKLNGNGEFIPSMDEINTPEELLRELDSVFQKKTPGLAEAFILTVLDDTRYDERHLVGYDVNPKNPGKVELWSHAEAVLKQDDLRKLSSRVLDSTFQEIVLVKPGRETRIPSRMIRKALR